MDRWAAKEAAPSFLVALRGGIAAANRCVDKQLLCLRRTAALPELSAIDKQLLDDAVLWLPPVMLHLRREADVKALLEATEMTWVTADSWWDTWQPDSMVNKHRPRGSDEFGKYSDSIEGASWVTKLAYVLSTTWDEVDPAEVRASLPTPERLLHYIDTTNVSELHGMQSFTSLEVLAALVCETKLERPAMALAFADLALSHDARGTPDVRPTTLVQVMTPAPAAVESPLQSNPLRLCPLGSCVSIGLRGLPAEASALRGRVLAQQGKQAQAEAAFAVATVRAVPGWLSAHSISQSKPFLYGVFYGRPGRLTNQNGVFRPGQEVAARQGLLLLELHALLDLRRAVPRRGGEDVDLRLRELALRLEGPVEGLQAALGAGAYSELTSCLEAP
jgi:hypothetical protein